MAQHGDESIDLVTLLRSLADSAVRLVSARLELAAGELRETAGRTGRGAGGALAGALLATVGLGLCAAAAVTALAPLLPSLPFRLLAVAVPFVVSGGVLIAASVRRLAHVAPNERDGERREREHQRDVDEGSEGVAAHHPERPQEQQEHHHQPEHRASDQ
ncbi:MAG TPA: phage holin family protein [Polyangia bacterium]